MNESMKRAKSQAKENIENDLLINQLESLSIELNRPDTPQKMVSFETEIKQKQNKKFISAISTIFTHINRNYFSDKLYRDRLKNSHKRNLKKFAKEIEFWDDREIIARLISSILYDCDIYVVPMGMSWFSECTEEKSEENRLLMQPLFDDYWQWQIEQR